MRIIVKASEFNSPNPLDRIYTISEFVDNIIEHSLYEAREVDQTALTIYFIVFYSAQVSSNGLLNFLRKNYMNVAALDHIHDGLMQIGATKHQDVFKEACEILNMLEPEAFESLIVTGDNNLENQFRSKTVPVCFGINELDKKFSDLENGEEKISDLLYIFIGTMKNIYIVHNSKYDEEMEKLFSEVPDYEKRLTAATKDPEENQVQELSSIVAEACTKFNLNLISIDSESNENIITTDEEQKINMQDGAMFCHFSTEEGKFYIVCKNNDISLYEEQSHKLVGNMLLN